MLFHYFGGRKENNQDAQPKLSHPQSQCPVRVPPYLHELALPQRRPHSPSDYRVVTCGGVSSNKAVGGSLGGISLI